MRKGSEDTRLIALPDPFPMSKALAMLEFNIQLKLVPMFCANTGSSHSPRHCRSEDCQKKHSSCDSVLQKKTIDKHLKGTPFQPVPTISTHNPRLPSYSWPLPAFEKHTFPLTSNGSPIAQRAQLRRRRMSERGRVPGTSKTRVHATCGPFSGFP